MKRIAAIAVIVCAIVGCATTQPDLVIREPVAKEQVKADDEKPVLEKIGDAAEKAGDAVKKVFTEGGGIGWWDSGLW